MFLANDVGIHSVCSLDHMSEPHLCRPQGGHGLGGQGHHSHCSPWCKKRGGFLWSNFKKWETLRSSFHKLRTSLFHCRVQNRGPESARDLFSLTQDLTFLNYWHRNRGPEFTHAFFSTLNGTKEANTSLMPFLDSRLKIPQWKEIRHYDSHEEKALPSCES